MATIAPDTGFDSATDDTNDSGSLTETIVADTNTGSGIDAAQGNNGSGRNSASTAAPANTGEATSVDRTSTTYYQSLTTTTTGDSDDGVRLAFAAGL